MPSLLDAVPRPLLPALGRLAGTLPGAEAVSLRVANAADVRMAAMRLSRFGAREAAGAAVALRGLLTLGGTTLFVQVRGRAAASVVLEPWDDHRIVVSCGSSILDEAVREIAPVAAHVRPGFRPVPALHHEPQSEPVVLVFSLRAQGECRVRFPAFATHATVHAGPHVLAAERALSHAAGPVVLRAA